MLNLKKEFALSERNGEPYSTESRNLSMRALTNIDKAKLQISLQSQYDHAGLERNLGYKLPDNPVDAVVEKPVFWLGQNEWLFVSDGFDKEALCQKTKEVLKEDTWLLTDLSDRFSIIELSGVAARELLMSGCGVDLSKQSFQAGQYRLTRITNLQTILYCQKSADTFWVLVDRSEAGYLWRWLCEAAELIEQEYS